MEKYKSLNERVVIAKKNIHNKDKLIEEYKPFIASVVQSKKGSYVEYGIDEELSIGLIAFNEAIDSYDISKGNFLSFAKVVIQRRLIDYARKRIKNDKGIVIEKYDNDKTARLYDIKSIEAYKIKNENELRQLEIEQYKKELTQWGLDFTNLIKHSPKQNKTRKLYKEIASKLITDTELMDYTNNKKRLPVQKIVNKFKIHRKKIERGRIYIIALIIILKGDYKYLKEYM